MNLIKLDAIISSRCGRLQVILINPMPGESMTFPATVYVIYGRQHIVNDT